jgi:hypothetical protein
MWRYQRFGGWLCRQQCRRTLVALSICGLLITGCAPVTGDAVRDARRMLGLEPTPLMHTDQPAPPTIDGFVQITGMAQARRLEFQDPHTGRTQVITNTQTIWQFVSLLTTPPQQITADPMRPGPRDPFKVTIVAGSPERIMTADYNPATATLLLHNTPDAHWRLHYVGSYTVPSAFGSALFATLGVP